MDSGSRTGKPILLQSIPWSPAPCGLPLGEKGMRGDVLQNVLAGGVNTSESTKPMRGAASDRWFAFDPQQALPRRAKP